MPKGQFTLPKEDLQCQHQQWREQKQGNCVAKLSLWAGKKRKIPDKLGFGQVNTGSIRHWQVGQEAQLGLVLCSTVVGHFSARLIRLKQSPTVVGSP